MLFLGSKTCRMWLVAYMYVLITKWLWSFEQPGRQNISLIKIQWNPATTPIVVHGQNWHALEANWRVTGWTDHPALTIIQLPPELLHKGLALISLVHLLQAPTGRFLCRQSLLFLFSHGARNEPFLVHQVLHQCPSPLQQRVARLCVIKYDITNHLIKQTATMSAQQAQTTGYMLIDHVSTAVIFML